MNIKKLDRANELKRKIVFMTEVMDTEDFKIRIEISGGNESYRRLNDSIKTNFEFSDEFVDAVNDVVIALFRNEGLKQLEKLGNEFESI